MSGLVKRKFFNRFIADDTSWTIPSGVTMLWIECIGGGGSGGSGEDFTGTPNSGGAGGGGGGAIT